MRLNTLTTTDRPLPAVPLRGIALALGLWFGGVALAAVALDPREVVVFGPAAATGRAIENAGAWPLSAGPGFVAARTESTGAVRRLYAAGAWFVWPAFRAGCGG